MANRYSNHSSLYQQTFTERSVAPNILNDLSIAQGKGYFFEKGNELTIPDNLFINGFIACPA